VGGRCWLQRVDADHENMRAVLAWSLTGAHAPEHSDAHRTLGLQLIAALWPFWFVRGYIQEWDYWHDLTLALPLPLLGRKARARALLGRAFRAVNSIDIQGASPLCEQSLDLYRELVLQRKVGFEHIPHSTLDPEGTLAAGRIEGCGLVPPAPSDTCFRSTAASLQHGAPSGSRVLCLWDFAL